MIYLILGALALWVILRGANRTRLPRREWRFVSAAAAVAALAGAAYASVREAWPAAIVLLAMGAWLALSTRTPPGAPGRDPGPATSPPPTGRMSSNDARNILGVAQSASPDEIQAAYVRLMRTVHPDAGGTAGLAAQLNAARDRLLKR